MPRLNTGAVARSILRSNNKRSWRQSRNHTTSSTAPGPDSTPNPPPPPSQNGIPSSSFLARNRRTIIWSTLGLALGGTLGTLVAHTISPPAHPVPGTHEDSLLLHDLTTRLDSDFKVKVLRGKCTAAAAGLRGSDSTWVELSSSPGTTLSTESPFMKDALGGARGLGAERVFWNQKEHELVAVVYFGGALSGWPGVTHGGCIATVLAEKMALAARLAAGKGGARVTEEVVAAAADVKVVELSYKKPTYANAFYVVRMLPRDAEETGALLGEVEVEGTLETMEGKLCVAVTGTVPVGEGDAAGLGAPIAVVQRAKSWIGWPSRSDVSQS